MPPEPTDVGFIARPRQVVGHDPPLPELPLRPAAELVEGRRQEGPILGEDVRNRRPGRQGASPILRDQEAYKGLPPPPHEHAEPRIAQEGPVVLKDRRGVEGDRLRDPPLDELLDLGELKRLRPAQANDRQPRLTHVLPFDP